MGGGCQDMVSLVLVTQPKKRSQTRPPTEAPIPDLPIPDPHGRNLEVTCPVKNPGLTPSPIVLYSYPWTGN